MLTRKRRLIQEVEARLAIGTTPYWEGGVDEGESDREEDGTPRRSRRGVGVVRSSFLVASNHPLCRLMPISTRPSGSKVLLYMYVCTP